MSAPEQSDLTVVFVMGNQRSGSTLLANLLGELDGVVSAGEVSNLWVNGVHGPRAVCGCRLPISECTYWRDILGPLLERGKFRPIREAEEATVRAANIWSRPARSSPHLAFVGDLYRAIARQSDARVIVDSSKSATYAATFNRLPGIAAHHLHIVRDPRGVLYSRQRGWEIRGQRDATTPPPLPRAEVARVAGAWVRNNAAAEAVSRRWADTSHRVRYEDLMARPEETLARTAEKIGLPGAVLPLEAPGTARLHVQHTAAGNPSRFTTGTVRLREDRAWERGVPLSHQVLAAAVTAPLLRRYGYPVLPHRPTNTQATPPTPVGAGDSDGAEHGPGDRSPPGRT